jgi:PAS domain S-box-containing protein
MPSVKKIFKTISQFGIKEDMDEFLKKKIVLTNKLSVILSFFFLVITVLLSVKFRLFTTSALLFILIIILAFVPFLNKTKHPNFARLLLSVVLPVFIYFASIYAKLNSEIGKEISFYFLPRTTMVITVIIPLLVLDYKKKVSFYLTIIFYTLCILMYSKVHEMLGIGINQAILTGDSYILASIIPVLILFILIAAFILMQNNNYQYEQNILNKNIKLKESEERYKVLSNASFEAIVISENGFCVEQNKTAEKMFGYSHKEAVGMFATDVFTDKSKKIIIKNILNGYTLPYDVIAIRKNGKTFNAEIQGQDFTYNGKKLRITAIRDITIRKKIEENLIIAKEKAEESDRLKTEFLHNMSHEIRTPLNGILGFSSLLNNPDLLPERRMEFTEIIHNSGEQLLQIIDNILEISELSTKQLKAYQKEVCLNDLLLNLFLKFNPKAEEKQIKLYVKKELSDKESTIFTDKSRLNKVLNNLLDNALKFTDTGSIELGYTMAEQIQIYVKDTGIGIRKEVQGLIFKRFSQGEKELSQKVGGLGLGLSIAKENTKLLGGNISLKSEKGKGSTFFVNIPYNKPKE